MEYEDLWYLRFCLWTGKYDQDPKWTLFFLEGGGGRGGTSGWSMTWGSNDAGILTRRQCVADRPPRRAALMMCGDLVGGGGASSDWAPRGAFRPLM